MSNGNGLQISRESINLIFHTLTILLFLLSAFILHHQDTTALKNKIDSINLFINQFPNTLTTLTNTLTEQSKALTTLTEKIDHIRRPENARKYFNSVERNVNYSNSRIKRELSHIDLRLKKIEALLRGQCQEPPTKQDRNLEWIPE